MGSLKEMIEFLNETGGTLGKIEKKLDELQRYFNDNFQNVDSIRRDEIEFLQNAFFAEPSSFPAEIRALYKKKLKDEEEAFEKNLKELENKRAELEKAYIAANNARLAFVQKLKENNVKLDAREEKLKEKVAALEKEIDEYNRAMKELESGFGIITNFFRMRKLQQKKEIILAKRDELVEHIEQVRAKWEEASKEYRGEEKKIMEEWTKAQTELALATEKLERLRANREEIIKKAAFVSALGEIKGNEPFLSEKTASAPPDTCPRCKSDNKNNRFFCYYCGERFSKDRPDVVGSLGEVGELNAVHSNLMKGIGESVSLIALIRGIAKGVAEFTKSVASVKSSEDRYPLPKLKIDVPAFSANFAKSLAALNEKIDVKYFNLHPLEFSSSFNEEKEKLLTEENIEKFFKGMGDELNRTTKAQWK